MNQLQWIKLSTGLFGNPKIRCLLAGKDGQAAVLLWVFLLTAAGRSNDGGRIGLTASVPYTPETLSVQCGITADEARSGLTSLQALEMIGTDAEGFLWICSWEEHQVQEKPAPDREAISKREQNRIRKARSRALQLQATVCEAAETNVTGHTDVTEESVTGHTDVTEKSVTGHTDVTKCHAAHNNIDIEKDKEEETDNNIIANNKRFRPPTVEEVAAFCAARGSPVDPRQFVDYYTANGWKVGRNKMSDWKAAVRTWERNMVRKTPPPACPPGTVMGPTGVPILVPGKDELEGIL